ncbi:MAG: tetratricopeptide repeat protein [Akkermansiaceae bacterium]|nr:tetratricopeptide repeat protein [Akkermansiaceae bacterium]
MPSPATDFSRFRMAAVFCVTAAAVFSIPRVSPGQADYKRFFDEENIPAAEQVFEAGRYELVLQFCEMAYRRGQEAVEWSTLRMRALATLGRADEALAVAEKIATAHPEDLPALMEVHDFYASIGKTAEAKAILDAVNKAALKKPKREDRTGPETVALGRAALALGADPNKVMAEYFDPVARAKPKTKDDIPPGAVEARAAAGELALEKSDYARAADEFRAALGFEPNDPDLRFGLARAFYPSDRKKANEALDRAIEVNPLHAPSLLLQAEYLIDSEEYAAARERVDRVLSYNERHPIARACEAALANLAENDAAAFAKARAAALESWPKNPEPDHVIGRILSRNYRFAEGAERQRAALEFDPAYLPAKLQLAHDLLRLGHEDEAWKLAEAVGEADPFEILAYNLTVLRDQIANFVTLQSPDFTIRLPANEAEIYGDRAMELLTESKRVLCGKYGLTLDHPVLVEFFPEQQDFAIRTFGNLGGAGILGACFGTVVTMNSPGGLAHNRNNWEATLWHEFCHVVTLSVTRNKMPRWLSEGISVHEEKQRDPTWGQAMTPQYREMILEKDLLYPIAELSGAFTNPKEGADIMFAYFQSMMVVDFLVEKHGLAAFRGILEDLGKGVLVNDAIARHTGGLEKIEEAFKSYAAAKAGALGNDVDWKKPPPFEVDPRDPAAVAKFAAENPKNFWALDTHAGNLMAQQRWKEAVETADRLIALYPEDAHPGNAHEMKAAALRALNDAEGEAETLRHIAERSSEARTAYLRLLDIDLAAENWPDALVNADRALAIDPFSKQVHFCRGCALEGTGRGPEAAGAFEKLLKLKPVNPSEVRFRLARLLKGEEEPRARRHLLDALAESTRYRDAHRLLLEFQKEPAAPAEPAAPIPTPPAAPETKP